MRSLSRASLLLAVLSAAAIASAPPVNAAETAASQLVIISEDDVISDDLYAAASRVIIDGVLDGDLIAFASEEVLIRGEVTGSVIAVAPQVTVEGTVGGSVRASADSVLIDGEVDRDVVAAALSVELGSSSRVVGDVLIWSPNASLSGFIGGTLGGTQGSLDLEGSIAGDVDITVGRLTVTGPLEVSGDLGYRSDRQAEGLDQATVGGVTVKKSPQPANVRLRAITLLARILLTLFLTTTALLVAWGWPARTDRAAIAVREQPWRSFGLGVLVVLSPALLGGAVGLVLALAPSSAALPLLAIFAPLVLALTGIVLALSLVAGVPAVVALGRTLRGRLGLYGALLLGSVVVSVVWLIPLVGWIVPLLTLPFGTGAWIVSRQLGEATAEDVAATSETTDD